MYLCIEREIIKSVGIHGFCSLNYYYGPCFKRTSKLLQCGKGQNVVMQQHPNSLQETKSMVAVSLKKNFEYVAVLVSMQPFQTLSLFMVNAIKQ